MSRLKLICAWSEPRLRLASAGAKGFEPEDIGKRLVVEDVQPTSVYIASAHASEAVALDNDALADWRQDGVNGCC